ncbi:MAG: hypothetical protein ACRCTA_05800 [Bacilli bacterium]
MNFKSILKMELYKFFQDKPLLIAAIVLGVLNTLMISIGIGISNEAILDSSGIISVIIVIILLTSLLASFIILLLYPFQCVCIDYKNNVLATMIASGVDRVKYYFTKLIVININTMVLLAIIFLVPFLVLLFNSEIDLNEFGSLISASLEETGLSLIFVFSFIVGTIYNLVLVYLSCMITKGSVAGSIGCYFGFSIARNIVYAMVIAPLIFISSDTFINPFIYEIIFNTILSAALMIISINVISKQDL